MADTNAIISDSKELYDLGPVAWRAVLDVFPHAILVLDQAQRAVYCNPAFERIFGWPLDDIAGRAVDFVPPGQVQATNARMQQLYRDKTLRGFPTRRLTRAGVELDVIMDAALLSGGRGEPAGLVVTLRELTGRKRRARNRRMVRRMSGTLHRFRRLDELLGYVTRLTRAWMRVDSAAAILLAPDAGSLVIQKASHADPKVARRMEGLRFPADQGAAGQVCRTGKALLVADCAGSPYGLPAMDGRPDHVTRNMLVAPLRTRGQGCIGVLSTVNKHEGGFDDQDTELLCAIADAVALPIENTEMGTALELAYEKIRKHDQARDRVIHQLSHELKTPLAVLAACMRLLRRAGSAPGDPRWGRIHDRIDRNLNRLLDMEYKLEDILRAGENPGMGQLDE